MKAGRIANTSSHFAVARDLFCNKLSLHDDGDFDHDDDDDVVCGNMAICGLG